jgi:hypothetical protein
MRVNEGLGEVVSQPGSIASLMLAIAYPPFAKNANSGAPAVWVTPTRLKSWPPAWTTRLRLDNQYSASSFMARYKSLGWGRIASSRMGW